MNLSDWMSELPEDVKISRNITQIAIPGSHDCGTWKLDKSLPVGPDESDTLQELGNNPLLGPSIVKPIMLRWSTTQHSSIGDQLKYGVRYFDFRIGKIDGNYRVLHGLYGPELMGIFEEIKFFLADHSGEVVILDFQHMFDCSDEDHQAIISAMLSMFENKLLEKGKLSSLKEMQDTQKQVIVIYQESYCNQYDFLWPRGFCPNPWANTMNISNLLKFLSQHLSKRPANCLFVTQAVLTPRVKTILLAPFSTLFKATKDCRRALPSWLTDEAASLKPNIIMTDFVTDYPINSIIVGLNHPIQGL